MWYDKNVDNCLGTLRQNNKKTDSCRCGLAGNDKRGMGMKRKVSLGILVVLLLTMVFPQAAMADVLTDGLPNINASGYIVIEGSTGEVLFGRNYAAQADPADLVKMMTAVLAIESCDMERVETIGELPEAVTGGNSKNVVLRKGEKKTVYSLLQASIIYSANDATWALAEIVSGNEEKFVALMNEKAKALGMKNTTFKNCHGLPAEGQVTTAEDMAILGRYAMSLPKYREIASTKSFHWVADSYESDLVNVNTLFEVMPEATGVKSGDVKNGDSTATTYNLVGSAEKDGRELIGVIIGDTGKVGEDMKQILNYGFENTKVVPVVQKDAAMTTIAYDDKKQIRVVAGENYSVVRPADNNAIVETKMVLNDIDLPIKKDQKVGVLTILSDGATIGEVPLVSMDDARGSINWLLIFTCIMTILYIAQMLVRTYRMLRKSYFGSRPASVQQRPGNSVRREQTTQQETTAKRRSLSDRSNRPLDR